MKIFKISRLVFVIFISFSILGCGYQTHSFVGESDHWKGEYTIDKAGDHTTEVFTFNYKNAKKTSFKNLEVTLKVGSSNVQQKEPLHNGSTVVVNRSYSGGANNNEKKIPVTIKWDNKYKESFSLEQK